MTGLTRTTHSTVATPPAITGKVFFDANPNGVAEPSETGVAKVAVSDGRTVLLTAKDGTYTLADPSYSFRCLVAIGQSVRSTSAPRPARVINFPLTKWPESTGDVARFVQITDIHMDYTSDAVSTFKDDLAEIDAVEPKASFVLATGDIVHEGKINIQFDNYREGIDTLDLPLFDFPGNHDVENEETFDNYHHCRGPDYYSFNFAGCHFVLINDFPYAYKPESFMAEFLDTGRLPTEAERPRGITQLEWIERDVAAAPPGSTIIFGAHFLPSPTMLRRFTSFGAKAVLSGHWHGPRVREEAGLLDLNSPPFRFGGIDRHPRSFRVIDIASDGIRNELRLGG